MASSYLKARCIAYFILQPSAGHRSRRAFSNTCRRIGEPVPESSLLCPSYDSGAAAPAACVCPNSFACSMQQPRHMRIQGAKKEGAVRPSFFRWFLAFRSTGRQLPPLLRCGSCVAVELSSFGNVFNNEVTLKFKGYGKRSVFASASLKYFNPSVNKKFAFLTQ
uniref:Uncharacterized protein n=1 Tax=Anopheles atroparvus TaxID=41427 RepID=A0AAG5DMI0_ANOAO